MRQIDRAFVRTPFGLLHLRQVAGEGRPLLMLHASPLSSRMLTPLIEALGELGLTAPILAPDTPGNGDSEPSDVADPDIGHFAQIFVSMLDALEIPTVDLFGMHTGGRIACELAVRHPDRIRRLVIDGIAEYPPETRAWFAEHYTPDMAPDALGTHLITAFHYMRNQYLFFPWFAEDAEHRLTQTLPPPQTLHDAALDVLKSLATYHLPYKAAFAYPAGARMAAVTIPTLLLRPAGVSKTLADAADKFANGRNIAVRDIAAGDASIAAAIVDFLR